METIAVVFGGRSAEHDVSIVTAIASVIKPLELSGKYRVLAIYIAKNGAWYSAPEFKNIELFTSGKIDQFIKQNSPVAIKFDGGMQLVNTGKLGRQSVQRIDIVFPAMHGTYGEDGALMGLLDMAGIPYVGCGVMAGAVAMDKVATKQLAESNGIAVSDYFWFSKQQFEAEPEQVKSLVKSKLIKFPVFVKPAHLGSSIGISRVSKFSELANAIEVALHFDDKVIIESEVPNLIEVTLPIMGNDQPKPALLEQPLTKAQDFFDFETKYMQGGKKGKGGKSGKMGAQGYSLVPSPLPKPLYQKAEQLGISVYKALGCSGVARIDMLIDQKANEVYLNEVNPLPGDLYAHNWNKAGISNVELVTKLVDFAKQRHDQREALTTTFGTNYLQQF